MTSKNKKMVLTEKVDDIDLADVLVEDISEYSNSQYIDLLREHNMSDSLFEVESDSSDEIKETLSIKEIAITKQTVVSKEYQSISNLNDDFEIVRQNLIELTAIGNQMISPMIDLAKASDHPNAFKAVTETLTALSQLNKDLLDAYEKKLNIEAKLKKLEEKEKTENPTTQTNTQNNFYNMTTDEMFRNLKEQGMIGHVEPN